MIIYKIVSTSEWRIAEEKGTFDGAPVDLADGFIHFSAADQVKETAAKHFAGKGDLLLIGIDEKKLGPALKWEPSRGGALFPHLYDVLDLSAVVSRDPLPLGPDGAHLFPDLEAGA